MLGWNVSVYRLQDGGVQPATSGSAVGPRLAVWQTGDGGLDWLCELAKDGKAVDLGGDGYPCQFTAQAEYVIPRIIDTPPHAREVWGRDVCDFVDETWEGKTVIDRDQARKCRFDEWLSIVAWDES